MKLLARQKRTLNNAGNIILAGVLISLVYPVFSDGFSDPLPFINSFFIGLIGGSFVALCELELFPSRKIIQIRAFMIRVGVKAVLYFIFFAFAIPTIVLLTESVYRGSSIGEHFRSTEYQDFLFNEDLGIILIYALVFLNILIFGIELVTKMGQGVLWNYVTGKYHHPKKEERIFMFIDLNGSTTIAENMEGILYHEFINDFIKGITTAVLPFRGIVYRYVGDQVGVTWHMDRGLENANCIRAYLYARNINYSRREKYLTKYGMIPHFITCLHCGEVVIGEIGDIKSQIVYFGKTIQELAQIEKEFKHHPLEEPILISERLINRLKLPALYIPKRIGEMSGNNDQMSVYTLEENPVLKGESITQAEMVK